jgi:hypothetical protein
MYSGYVPHGRYKQFISVCGRADIQAVLSQDVETLGLMERAKEFDAIYMFFRY